jgi:hypothetical protein
MAVHFVNGGPAIVTNLVSGIGGTVPKFVAIGSGGVATTAADTSLSTEYTTGTWTGYARTSNTPTRTTTTQTNDTLNVTGTFTAGAAQTVTNAGCFDASTSGNLFVKGDFTGVVLANGDSIQINITWQVLAN